MLAWSYSNTWHIYFQASRRLIQHMKSLFSWKQRVKIILINFVNLFEASRLCFDLAHNLLTIVHNNCSFFYFPFFLGLNASGHKFPPTTSIAFFYKINLCIFEQQFSIIHHFHEESYLVFMVVNHGWKVWFVIVLCLISFPKEDMCEPCSCWEY